MYFSRIPASATIHLCICMGVTWLYLCLCTCRWLYTSIHVLCRCTLYVKHIRTCMNHYESLGVSPCMVRLDLYPHVQHCPRPNLRTGTCRATAATTVVELVGHMTRPKKQKKSPSEKCDSSYIYIYYIYYMSYDLKECISYILHIMHIYISCIMIDVKAYIKLYIHILIILAKICTSTRSETLRTDSRGFYRDSVEMNSHLFATNIQPIAGYWIPIPAVSNWYQREIIVVWSAGIHLLVPPKLEHTKSVFF